MLLNILEGTDKTSSLKLEELRKKVGENPNILWYPASGCDYRDIYETVNPHFLRNPEESLPDIYLHTDFDEKAVFDGEDLIYDSIRKRRGFDNHSGIRRIEMTGKFKIKLKKDIKHNCIVDDRYAVRHGKRTYPFKIFLLEILITTLNNQKISKPVIFFIAENISFYEEILLKNNIKIKYIVKVREGLGFGGCRKSIFNIFPLLSTLGTEYIITDWEDQFDDKIFLEIVNRNKITAKKPEFEYIGHIRPWSGFDNIRVYKVRYGKEITNITGLRSFYIH